MSSWFITLYIILVFSSSFLQAQYRASSEQRYAASAKTFFPPSSFSFDDNSKSSSNADSLTESSKIPSKYRANEEQIEQFTRLLYDRLNLKEPPNVRVDVADGTGIPSPIIKQLEKDTKEHQITHHNEEIISLRRQKIQDETQSTTERAILPGDSIPHHTCQRQLASKLNLQKESLYNIDCFRFSKSSETKNLPTNQIIKQLRIYVKKTYFSFNNQQDDVLTPNMFQIYQVYRPTSNDTLYKPMHGFTDTVRLTIQQIKQLNDNWLELTIEPNNGQITIQQIYKQFIMPWYGLAINRELQPSWSNFYRRFYSKKHLESFYNSGYDDNQDDFEQQLPYMLVEYGEKFPSRRNTRAASRARPARSCDPKSPCCRRPLTIDLDQGNNALNFVIYPRQLDIGECIGLCGVSGTSLKHTDAKNDRNQNYNLFLLNGVHHNRTSTTQHNKSEQPTGQCCSFSRTGGLELLYTTTNGGPIIRKFIPNIIVEECRCGLAATI